MSGKDAAALDEDRQQPGPARDADAPDELDALPGADRA
jgi:hypothetical protein